MSYMLSCEKKRKKKIYTCVISKLKKQTKECNRNSVFSVYRKFYRNPKNRKKQERKSIHKRVINKEVVLPHICSPYITLEENEAFFLNAIKNLS